MAERNNTTCCMVGPTTSSYGMYCRMDFKEHRAKQRCSAYVTVMSSSVNFVKCGAQPEMCISDGVAGTDR